MHTHTIICNHQYRLIILIIKLAHSCRLLNNMVFKTPWGKLKLFDYKFKYTKKAV